MSSRLDEQLRRYGEYLDATLAETESVSSPVRTTSRRPPDRISATSPAWRRGFLVAAGAAMIVLLAVGVAILVADPFATEEAPPAVTTVPPSPTEPGRLQSVAELTIATDGSLWAATRAGLVRWDLPTREASVYTEWDGLPTQSVSSVTAAPDGSVWASGEEWVARYDGGTWSVYTSDRLPELDGVGEVALAVGGDGTVWLVADSGAVLSHLDGDWVVAASPPAAGTVPWAISVAGAPDGALWTASPGNGGVVLSFAGREWHRYGPADGVPVVPQSVAVASDGSIWVGSMGLYGDPSGDVQPSGIAQFDSAAWTTFTTGDGLPSNEAIVVTGTDGSVWALHPAEPAVSRFDGTTWTVYPGIRGGREAAVGPDGTLWFSSATGITGFDGSATIELALPDAASVPGPPAITLAPVPGSVPTRVSTVLGDFEFTRVEFPPGYGMLSEAKATPHGLVGVAEQQLWWSINLVTWHRHDGPVAFESVSVAGDEVVAFGDTMAVRFAWADDRWAEAARITTDGPLDVLVAGPGGLVGSGDGRIYLAPDGEAFTAAGSGPVAADLTESGARVACAEGNFPLWSAPLPDTFVLLPADEGLVALVAGMPGSYRTDEFNDRLMCEPTAWFSPDGRLWEAATVGSPFGEGSFVRDVANRDGRFVATGGVDDQAAVWWSDDGLTWHRAGVEMSDAQTVSGGELGFVLTGTNGPSFEGDPRMWFSTDGVAWDGPYGRPEGMSNGLWSYIPIHATVTVGSDSLFGIGIDNHEFNWVIGRLVTD